MVRFEWDERKARRNLRKHGISFPVAQAAIESGLAVELFEQFHEGEWRTVLAAPVRSILITVVVAVYDGEHDEGSEANIEADEEGTWSERDTVIRIISARHASRRERQFYVEARPANGG
jgi:uncharacterized DUF497 family protein